MGEVSMREYWQNTKKVFANGKIMKTGMMPDPAEQKALEKQLQTILASFDKDLGPQLDKWDELLKVAEQGAQARAALHWLQRDKIEPIMSEYKKSIQKNLPVASDPCSKALDLMVKSMNNRKAKL